MTNYVFVSDLLIRTQRISVKSWIIILALLLFKPVVRVGDHGLNKYVDHLR